MENKPIYINPEEEAYSHNFLESKEVEMRIRNYDGSNIYIAYSCKMCGITTFRYKGTLEHSKWLNKRET